MPRCPGKWWLPQRRAPGDTAPVWSLRVAQLGGPDSSTNNDDAHEVAQGLLLKQHSALGHSCGIHRGLCECGAGSVPVGTQGGGKWKPGCNKTFTEKSMSCGRRGPSPGAETSVKVKFLTWVRDAHAPRSPPPKAKQPDPVPWAPAAAALPGSCTNPDVLPE